MDPSLELFSNNSSYNSSYLRKTRDSDTTFVLIASGSDGAQMYLGGRPQKLKSQMSFWIGIIMNPNKSGKVIEVMQLW